MAQKQKGVTDAMIEAELIASCRSRESYAHSARGTPAPPYPRGASEQCVAPVADRGTDIDVVAACCVYTLLVQ